MLPAQRNHGLEQAHWVGCAGNVRRVSRPNGIWREIWQVVADKLLFSAQEAEQSGSLLRIWALRELGNVRPETRARLGGRFENN